MKQQYWKLNRPHHLTDLILEILLATFGQLDFDVILESDGSLVIILVVNEVIKVDQVGFVGAEEILAWQAAFDLFQDLCQHVFFPRCGNDFGVPAPGNATKDFFHPEKLNSPGGFNRYFCCVHMLSI